MFDTLAIARALTAGKLTSEQADTIMDAVRQAAKHGKRVTSGMLRPKSLRSAAISNRALLPWADSLSRQSGCSADIESSVPMSGSSTLGARASCPQTGIVKLRSQLTK